MGLLDIWNDWKKDNQGLKLMFSSMKVMQYW